METYLIGTKETQLTGFQSSQIQSFGTEIVSGFELAYLSRWPYLQTNRQIEVPQSLIQYLNSNSKLFCQDKIVHNSGWSYLAVFGLLEYLFLSNDEIAFKNTYGKKIKNENVFKVWPEIYDLLFQLPFDVVSASIFALQPRSKIAVHIDKNKYGIDKFLIPLNKPQNAHFVFYQYGAVPLEEGHVYAIDASHTHYAVNHSDEVRYHLIVRGCFEKKWTEYLQWLQQSFLQTGEPVFEKVPYNEEWLPSNLISLNNS